MEIPESFYGRAAHVKASARRLAKAIVKAGAFDVFEPGRMLDTAQTPGVIYVQKEWSPSETPPFHCYALDEALILEATRLGRSSLLQDWVAWSLEAEWRFPFVIAGSSRAGLHSDDPEVLRRYVDASVTCWPMLRDAGKRFGPSGEEPVGVWDVWWNLRSALVSLGVPGEALKECPVGGPAELRALIPP